MIERRSHVRVPLWIAPVVILSFALACIWFASRQNIWIDESTQLSGITLAPGALIQWLSGVDTGRFGVPGDRMPPLGYLLDWAWWNGVSNSVFGFRLFHAACVVMGLSVFAAAERRFVGGRWAIVGLLFLAMSPKTIQFAVELRSYPMFFALACVQAAMVLRLISAPVAPSMRALLLFACICIVTYFTHFFGVVATCAYFGALLLRFVRTAPGRVVAAGIVAMLPSLALKPFVTGASAISGVIAVGVSPSQYVLQLFAGSAYLVWPIAGLLFLAGCAILIAAGVFAAIGRAAERRSQPVDYMIVVAGLGTIATILPHFWISSFDTLKPTYSIWLLPVLALIMSSGAREVSRHSRWFSLGRLAAIGALTVGALVSTVIFLTHADWYVHGPANAIAAAAQAAPPNTPIVYFGAETYSYGYFPTVYNTHGRANQWLATGQGVKRLPEGRVQPLQALSGYPEILVVETRLRRYSDLGDKLKGHVPAWDRSAELDALLAGGRWTETATSENFGYYDTAIVRLKAKAR